MPPISRTGSIEQAAAGSRLGVAIRSAMQPLADQMMGDETTLGPDTLFLQKPFTMDALMSTIRRALDDMARES